MASDTSPAAVAERVAAWRNRRGRVKHLDLAAACDLIEALAADLARVEAERDEARALGDSMQSDGDRMASWLSGHAGVPYEVRSSAMSFLNHVQRWTRLRVSSSAALAAAAALRAYECRQAGRVAP